MSVLERAGRRAAHELGFDLRRIVAPATAAANMLAEARDLIRHGDEEARDFLTFCLPRLMLSRSQILQDLFVLHQTGEKRGGYFVEFGATDGLTRSNTYALETHYGWTGIVAEPARVWHDALNASRGCAIDLRCVSDRSGAHILFNQSDNPELSSIAHVAGAASRRRSGSRYEVETVSLDDLLDYHGAPSDIDYLSVDTEGSELAILSAFDFERHRPRVLTVEHNFSADRDALFSLLSGKGYVRRLVDIAQMDDWYVLAD